MIECLLENAHWFRTDSLSVKGYCFDEKNVFFSGEQLLSYFESVNNEKDFESKLQAANGIFSVIIHRSDFSAFAIDRTRVYPLFYTQKDHKITVSDNPYVLLPTEVKFDSRSVDEYNHISFVLENRTLIDGVFQAPPSSYIIEKENGLSTRSYSSFLVKKGQELVQSEAPVKIEEAFKNSIERLIKSANKRQLALPLSGGYDSRLIACLLKMNGYEDVVCYNVGRPGNPEHILSSKVAEALGYKYYFIDNSSVDIISGYIESETFDKYYKFSGNLSNSFWMYEYFGVKFLIENKLIQPDAIFIPGHSGDFLGGSQFSKAGIPYDTTKETIIDKLIQYNFCLGDTVLTQDIIKVITSFVENYSGGKDEFHLYSIYENFVYLEKLPKFINNSVRLYEFYGHEVRLFFWDNELLDVFKRTPYNLRLNKTLYDSILKNKYFIPMKVSYVKEMQAPKILIKWQQFKNGIKRNCIPFCIRKRINRIADYTCMKEISEPLKEDLKQNGIVVHGSYSNVFLKWNFFKVRTNFKGHH